MRTEEAAKLLGIAPRTLREYINRGFIQAKRDKGSGHIRVSLHDAAAFAGNLLGGWDLVNVAKAAVRALVSAHNAERRLGRLEALLGVDSTVLDTSEEGVSTFYQGCSDLMADYTEDMSATDVLEWAYKLSNVTEEYLKLVTLYVADPEPWELFLNLAQKLYDSAPRSRFHSRKDLEAAYGYVASARRHLRQVAFFYIRNKYGAKKAAELLPEAAMGERDEKILKLIFMMKQKWG